MNEYLTQVSDLARILGGFGLVTILLAILKRNTERRRWSKYQREINQWLNDLAESMSSHPKTFSEDEWRAVCEDLMTESGFTPSETGDLLSLAVVVAKRSAADRFYL